MKILVIGHNGQVAQALRRENSKMNLIVALGRPELDICDKASVEKAILCTQPDIVINTAAYTAVDKAEVEIAQAFLVNRDGAKNVAEATAAACIPLIHISTDYVFNGASSVAYKEDDAVGPLNIYGLSKLQSEWVVSEANPQHIILRTAWLYSSYGHNFLKTMLRLAHSHDELKIVADQWGTPTNAQFFASCCVAIAQHIIADKQASHWRGIFNLVADGYTNWAEFAVEVFKSSYNETGKIPIIKPITTKDYKALAKRPQFSKLDNNKFKTIFNLPIKAWQCYL